MSTPMYTFDLRTYETTGSRTAQIVGGKELTISAAATPVPTGPDKTGHTQVYKPKGTARWVYDPQSLDVASQGEHGTWYYIADHRQHMDEKGTKQGGTPFWLPAEGDDYTSSSRYMDSLGPLPEGAVTERPEKPAPTPQEIDSAREVEIKAELQSIDAQSGRPARAVALATVRGESPDTEDVARLEELEVQAQALREELRQITARLEAQIATEDRML